MQKPLIIQQELLSPKVILNKEKNIFFIYGKSITINAHEFYLPIREWFEEYFSSPNEETKLIIYLEYLNSSSLLQIKTLMNIFNEYRKSYNVKILWLYDEDDETLKETGKEFQYSTFLNFEVKEVNEDEVDNLIHNNGVIYS